MHAHNSATDADCCVCHEDCALNADDHGDLYGRGLICDTCWDAEVDAQVAAAEARA